MFRRIFSCVFLVAILVPSFTLAADSSEVIKNADKQFYSDTRSQGLDGWLKWFAPDGYVGNEPNVRGTEGLKQFYARLFSHKDLTFKWSPDRAEVFPSGTMGYTTGRYTLNFTDDDGKKVNRTGNYLSMWQKQKDGSWKVMADFGSVDNPK
jgi:ketosteroid isomerase-like protein